MCTLVICLILQVDFRATSSFFSGKSRLSFFFQTGMLVTHNSHISRHKRNTHASTHVGTHVGMHVSTHVTPISKHMSTDMLGHTPVYMRGGMCADISVDMCADMCVGMHADMCADMCG